MVHIHLSFPNQTAINGDTATETSVHLNFIKFIIWNFKWYHFIKINTVNPAVIPAAFQDGKFEIHITKIWLIGQQTLTSVSSSGQYEIDTTIGLATGSQSGYVEKSLNETIFYAPVSNIDSNIGTNSLGVSGG